MDNFTSNLSIVQQAPPVGPQDNALFLVIILITMGISLLIITALITDTQTNQVVRVILINLLLSGLVSSLAIVIHDFLVMVVGANYTGASWQVVVVTFYFGGSARVLFATMYAVTIFLLVKVWEKPITKPRSRKYFILTAAVIWIVAFCSAAPLISTDVTFGQNNELCNCSLYPIVFVAGHGIIFSILPAIITVIMLMVTVCYHKLITLPDKVNDRKVLKGLLKFGLFLMVVQGFNVVAIVIIPIMYTNLDHALFDDTYFSFRSVFDGVHLCQIPTPALILIFFKPARDTLAKWLTCRCLCQKRSTAIPSSTGVGIRTVRCETISTKVV